MIEAENDQIHTILHDSKLLLESIHRMYEDKINNYLSKQSLIVRSLPKRCQYEVLEESLNTVEKELVEAKTAYSATCERVLVLKQEQEKLKKELDDRKSNEEMRARKKADLENEYSLLANSKVSFHDEQLIEKTKLQYKAVRNITQVKFLYDRQNSGFLEGFVFNKFRNKVKSFLLNLSKLNEEQIQERILAVMEETCGTNPVDVDKE